MYKDKVLFVSGYIKKQKLAKRNRINQLGELDGYVLRNIRYKERQNMTGGRVDECSCFG
jgi:hypothetical protein